MICERSVCSSQKADNTMSVPPTANNDIVAGELPDGYDRIVNANMKRIREVTHNLFHSD